MHSGEAQTAELRREPSHAHLYVVPRVAAAEKAKDQRVVVLDGRRRREMNETLASREGAAAGQQAEAGDEREKDELHRIATLQRIDIRNGSLQHPFKDILARADSLGRAIRKKESGMEPNVFSATLALAAVLTTSRTVSAVAVHLAGTSC